MNVQFIDDVDVVIIGAGIMGLSTAYYLSQRGLKICIVEREHYIGGYTTLRCAGGIRQQFSSELNVALSILNRQMLHKIEEETHYRIPFNSCGYAFAFTKADSAAQAESAVRIQHEMSVNTKILSSHEITAMFPNIYVGDVLLATYCQDDGLLNVGVLLSLLKRELDKRNVKILCQTVACGIETKNGCIDRVLLNKGEIKTSIVVNAAGPWSKQVGAMIGLNIPIEPFSQQLWVTEQIPWVKSNMPVIIFGDEGIGFHWESGGLLSGYHKPYREENSFFPTVSMEWDILHCEKAVERVPCLYDKRLVSQWAGFYETTVDDFPVVGLCGIPGMYSIAGFNGHGLMQGLACGYLLSKIITKEAIDFDISQLSLDRFQYIQTTNKEKYKI